MAKDFPLWQCQVDTESKNSMRAIGIDTGGTFTKSSLLRSSRQSIGQQTYFSMMVSSAERSIVQVVPRRETSKFAIRESHQYGTVISRQAPIGYQPMSEDGTAAATGSSIDRMEIDRVVALQ